MREMPAGIGRIRGRRGNTRCRSMGHELAVMRDDQDDSARACRRGKLMRDDFHVRAVEPARRLVEDKHVAIRKQGAGDGEQRCRRPPSSIERISSGVNSARMRPFSR